MVLFCISTKKVALVWNYMILSFRKCNVTHNVYIFHSFSSIYLHVVFHLTSRWAKNEVENETSAGDSPRLVTLKTFAYQKLVKTILCFATGQLLSSFLWLQSRTVNVCNNDDPVEMLLQYKSLLILQAQQYCWKFGEAPFGPWEFKNLSLYTCTFTAPQKSLFSDLDWQKNTCENNRYMQKKIYKFVQNCN